MLFKPSSMQIQSVETLKNIQFLKILESWNVIIFIYKN